MEYNVPKTSRDADRALDREFRAQRIAENEGGDVAYSIAYLARQKNPDPHVVADYARAKEIVDRCGTCKADMNFDDWAAHMNEVHPDFVDPLRKDGSTT